MGDLALYRPCDQRVHSWFEQTRTPFDPFLSMRCLLHRSVRCPSCGERCNVRKWPYATGSHKELTQTCGH